MTAHDRTDLQAGPHELRAFLTYRMARAQAKLNAQAIRILRQTSGIGLTQWRIIAFLGAELGPARTSQIRQEMEFDKGLFSRAVSKLEADGMLVTGEDQDDHRMQCLALTDTGRAIYEQTLPVMRRRQAALSSVLTPDERATLISALGKLEQAAELEILP